MGSYDYHLYSYLADDMTVTRDTLGSDRAEISANGVQF